MRWSIHIGRLFGIRIEVHVTFLMLVLFVALNPTVLTSGRPTDALTAVLLLLLIFACVLLHELGHALTARRFGIRTRDIILLPFGGVARLERMPERPQQEILVAIAGPLVNVVLAGILYLFIEVLHVGGGTGQIMAALLVVNVVMLLFNLLPAFPMDGGRVLRALLALRLPYTRATRIASIVGQTVALLFGLFGLINGNVMLMFVALFVFLAAGEERTLVQTRTSLAGLPVRAAMLTDFHALEIHEPLRRAVDYLMAGSQQDFPVMEGDRLVGLLTRGDLIRALQQGGVDTPVSEAIAPEPWWADASDGLEDVVMRMRARARSAMPVLSQGRLVGLLTLENVGDLLLVRDALQRWATTSA